MKHLSRSLLRPVFPLLAAPLLAPALPAQEGRFGEQIGVVQVEIPVQVLRDGEPVRGLTREDFEVFEGRKQREIVGFEVVDLSMTSPAPGAPVPQPPVAARRHFLLLFDLSFSSPSSIVRSRQAAIELVRTALHPTDLVALATVSATDGVRLPLGFTSDREQVEYAITTLALPQLVESVRDPLGVVLADKQAFGEAGAPGSGLGTGPGGGGKPGGEERPNVAAELEQLLESMDAGVRHATDRNRILDLTSQLASLAAVLRDIEGRKYVLFLSEGFDASVIMGIGRGITAEEREEIQAQGEAAATGEVWNVDSNLRFGETSSQNQLSLMLAEFVKAGCTIQSIDTAGLQATDEVRRESYGEDGLFVMAKETGGEFLRNYNNLNAALGEVLERTSVTYLLAFQPQDLEYDGKFHEIRVRLKDGDRGMRLVHRPGYFAPLPFAQRSGIERRLTTAELILGGEEGGELATSLLTGAFPTASGGNAYVPVLIEVEGESLLSGFDGEQLPTEIYGYALAADGSVADFFTQMMQLDVAQHGAALRQSGLKFWGHLELPPGDYSLRVLARNGATGASGLRVAAVAVPASGAAQLLPPLLPEPANKWLLGRQQGVTMDNYPYPFLLGNEPIIPAAHPVMTPNSQNPIVLAGYNLGGETLAARAELEGLNGEAVQGVELKLEQRLAGGAPGFERLVGALTVGAVPAGSYDLVVTVRDETSGATQTSRLPVEIGG